MASEQNSLVPWTPSRREHLTAEYKAAGYSNNRTAELVGCDVRTVWRDTQNPEWVAYMQELREKLVSAQRPLFEHSVSLAQQIVLRRLTGEPVDDDDYARAVYVLERTLWRATPPRAAIDAARDLKRAQDGDNR